MAILNFGSLNIDHVYRVHAIARPGETITSQSYDVFPGGKGANQSVALARAGANVRHAGKVGDDGRWLVDRLRGADVDSDGIEVVDAPTGHAVIQVDDAGENAIFLFPGTNRQISREQIDRELARCGADDTLLLQNEINDVALLIEQGKSRGMQVCVNPAPFDDSVRGWPLDQVDLLVVNETEAAGLLGAAVADVAGDARESVAALSKHCGDAAVVLTLGERGAVFAHEGGVLSCDAAKANVVDTTAAGDTFIGYLLAGQSQGLDAQACLALATKAAGICVSRRGATDAIPLRAEVV